MKKVTAKPVKAFEVSVDGEAIGTFVSMSTWNGMHQLEKVTGTSGTLIAAEKGEKSLFDIFGMENPDPVELIAISATNDISALADKMRDTE